MIKNLLLLLFCLLGRMARSRGICNVDIKDNRRSCSRIKPSVHCAVVDLIKGTRFKASLSFNLLV